MVWATLKKHNVSIKTHYRRQEEKYKHTVLKTVIDFFKFIIDQVDKIIMEISRFDYLEVCLKMI